MIKQELYNRTVDILVKAYFDDTLEHGDCEKCAVGNIVAGSLPTKEDFFPNDDDDVPWCGAWRWVFCTDSEDKDQVVHKRCYAGAAKRVIDATGYTWQELAKIEYAFETAPKGDSEDEWMFNGLMAVLSVLNKIHEVSDDTIISTNTKRFENARTKNVAVCS